MFRILAFIFISALLITNSFSQSKELKEKLKNLEGDVEKITIKTDKDEIEITGDEAEDLLSKMKKEDEDFFKVFLSDDSSKSFTWNGDNKLKHFKFFKDAEESDLKEHNKIYEFNDDDNNSFIFFNNGNRKEIEVEVENGEKKVTITTYENGKKKVETYTGDEAENFILEHEGDEDQIDIEIEKDNGEDAQTIIIKKKKINKESEEK